MHRNLLGCFLFIFATLRAEGVKITWYHGYYDARAEGVCFYVQSQGQGGEFLSVGPVLWAEYYSDDFDLSLDSKMAFKYTTTSSTTCPDVVDVDQTESTADLYDAAVNTFGLVIDTDGRGAFVRGFRHKTGSDGNMDAAISSVILINSLTKGENTSSVTCDADLSWNRDADSDDTIVSYGSVGLGSARSNAYPRCTFFDTTEVRFHCTTDSLDAWKSSYRDLNDLLCGAMTYQFVVSGDSDDTESWTVFTVPGREGCTGDCEAGCTTWPMVLGLLLLRAYTTCWSA